MYNVIINNIYKFLNINTAVKLKNKEKFLYQNIMEETGYIELNNKQKIWLTDRYLSVIKYGNFDKIKKEIKEDIEKINKDYIFSNEIREIIKESEMSKKDNINIETYITLSNSDLFFFY